ncbi:MAG: hypothetical protein HOP03_02125 [Lysobacter sp.]|nr:hypothetical protein [Lysobacter sp.]
MTSISDAAAGQILYMENWTKNWISTLVYSQSRGLCAVIAAQFAQERSDIGDGRMLNERISFSGDIEDIEGYVSASNVLDIFPVDKKHYLDSGALAMPLLDAHERVVKLYGVPLFPFGDRDLFPGRVSAVHASFSVQVAGRDRRYFHGGIEVTLDFEVKPEWIKKCIGAPVMTDSGRLAGFVAAANETIYMVVPAETFLAERGFMLATTSNVAEHNSHTLGPMMVNVSARRGQVSYGLQIAQSSRNYDPVIRPISVSDTRRTKLTA